MRLTMLHRHGRRSVRIGIAPILFTLIAAGLAVPSAADVTPKSPTNVISFDSSTTGARGWGISFLESNNGRRYVQGSIKDTACDGHHARLNIWFMRGTGSFDPVSDQDRIIRTEAPNTSGESCNYVKNFNYNTGISPPASIWVKACRRNSLFEHCNSWKRIRAWQ